MVPRSKRTLLVFFSFIVFVVSVLTLLWQYQPGLKQSILGDRAGGQLGTIKQVIENEIQVGTPFSLSVVINTNGKSVNAVGYYLAFDPNYLHVVSMDTKASFCQFYPEKKFDNTNGTISLACGSPHPGFKGENAIMEIEFLPRNVGLTTIRITPESKLLASDGKGTNILHEFPATEIPITAGIE